jgi:hypothetical protein
MNKLIYFYICLVTTIGIAFSLLAYFVDRGESSLIYWGLLPGLPFILLGLRPLIGIESFSYPPNIGAFFGALIATIIPYGVLLYGSITYSGGGANIGAGLLLLSLPIYLILFMLLGRYIGIKFTKLFIS